ncbi:hypothetical protein EB796_002277 [Bugula neritina]|uniref:Uncharacterized protein n=1 Tax=Bugula neritina TaxID=10212 RepID=A0A7J7KMP1_BUGNE|nr:hypothetical protein EB796_002277 [Bugula neritina]
MKLIKVQFLLQCHFLGCYYSQYHLDCPHLQQHQGLHHTTDSLKFTQLYNKTHSNSSFVISSLTPWVSRNNFFYIQRV